MMSYQVEIPKEQRITRAREALESVRELRRAKKRLGVDAIYEFVKDIDGNWLENWTDTSDGEVTTESVNIASVEMEFLVFEFRLYASVLQLFCVSMLNQMDCVNFVRLWNRDSIHRYVSSIGVSN